MSNGEFGGYSILVKSWFQMVFFFKKCFIRKYFFRFKEANSASVVYCLWSSRFFLSVCRPALDGSRTIAAEIHLATPSDLLMGPFKRADAFWAPPYGKWPLLKSSHVISYEGSKGDRVRWTCMTPKEFCAFMGFFALISLFEGGSIRFMKDHYWNAFGESASFHAMQWLVHTFGTKCLREGRPQVGEWIGLNINVCFYKQVQTKANSTSRFKV